VPAVALATDDVRRYVTGSPEPHLRAGHAEH
jgi:hypothetical protein